MTSVERSSENSEDHSLGRSSGPQVLKQVLTRAFLLTVSTKDPVSKDCQMAIVNYCREKCVYAYVVTETGKSGKLHLHAVMIYDTHREKKKLQENINNRIVRPNGHADAKNGIATLIQVCPGNKWYDEYLRKEVGVNVLYNHYDREAVLEYFPSEQLQEYLQARSRTDGPVDKHMAEHKRRWTEQFPDDSSYESAVKYFKYRMYCLEDMVIIEDKRRLCQKAWALYEYRNHITDACTEERNHGARMSGNALILSI